MMTADLACRIALRNEWVKISEVALALGITEDEAWQIKPHAGTGPNLVHYSGGAPLYSWLIKHGRRDEAQLLRDAQDARAVRLAMK